MSLFDDKPYSHFTFTYRSEGKDVTVNLDKNEIVVSELLEEFMNFLKASGYHFEIDDYFDVVNDFKTPNIEYPDTTKTYPFTTHQPDGSVTFKAPEEPFDPEVAGQQLKWIDSGTGEEHSWSTPDLNYKPEDY